LTGLTAAFTLSAVSLLCGGCDPGWFLDSPVWGMRDDGHRLYNEGRFADAAHMYEGALRRQPRSGNLSADLHVFAGRAWVAEADQLMAAGRAAETTLPLERALSHYRQAAVDRPDSPDAAVGAADVFRRQGRTELASETLRTKRIPRRAEAPWQPAAPRDSLIPPTASFTAPPNAAPGSPNTPPPAASPAAPGAGPAGVVGAGPGDNQNRLQP
jgi:hypothetical protein